MLFYLVNTVINYLLVLVNTKVCCLSLGMNAAIRAVVRMGIYAGARVFTVWEVSVYSCMLFSKPVFMAIVFNNYSTSARWI